MTREAGASIRLAGVHKAYGAVTAVDDLSLDVARGEFLTLLGASGCGKTTTLMLMAGFEQPTAGRVEINGRDMTRVPAQLRDQGFVFQNYALFPHLTVRRNLAYPLEVRGIPRAEIDARLDRALQRFGLGGLADRLPRELSGGQQQRTALARALIYGPPLLLMDEPLAALDKNLRAQLQREIKALQRELQVTIVYVTHDQDEALALSDRIAVMHRGRIEQVGTPEDLYERPDGEFVAAFMGEMNLIEVSLHVSQGRRRLCAAGGLDVAEAPPGREGRTDTRLKACLRPEKLRVASRPLPDGDWREATVLHRTYLGDAERYELDVLGEKLVARHATLPGGERFAVGARVAACWHDGDIRLVRASG